MKVKGLVWLGTRTGEFDPMLRFCRDVLGLSPTHVESNFAVLDMPNGDRMELFGSESPYNTFMTHPIAGFLVDDINSARAELEAQGVEFIGPIQKGPHGIAWSDFRAPDGFIYELTQIPGHPAS